MPLLNTKLLLLKFLWNLKHDCQLQYQEERSITHNTYVLPGKHKSKNPTIIYYVYIMDHETISYKTLIQELLVQYTIVSHCHTKIDKFMCQFTASKQPASSAQIPANGIPYNESKSSCLGCTFLMGTSNVCVVA
jgi:hypothetical protein